MIATHFMRPSQPQPSQSPTAKPGLIVTINGRQQQLSDKTPAIMVLPGGTFTASLPENPASTGFQWVAEAQGKGANKFLSLSDEYVQPDSNRPGSTGRREFTVKVKPGATEGGPYRIHFELRRPGADPQATPQDVKDLTVQAVCALPHTN